MKQPNKVRLVVRASKRQDSVGMFDEVRVVRVEVKRVRKPTRNK